MPGKLGWLLNEMCYWPKKHEQRLELQDDAPRSPSSTGASPSGKKEPDDKKADDKTDCKKAGDKVAVKQEAEQVED